MKPYLLSTVLAAAVALQANGQATIAKLKMEEAEAAYKSSDYFTALAKLDESEKILGSSNARYLYFRISTQVGLLKNELQVDLQQVIDLRRNCSTYLAKYEQGDEAKFREIYQLAEFYKNFDIPEQAFANIEKGLGSVADYELVADAYYFVEHYNRAIGYYKQAAAKNSGLAMARLGDMYLSGLGVKIDSVLGNSYIDKAIAAGHPDAFHTRAFSYYYGSMGIRKDSLKAIEYFRKSASAALPLAEKGNGEYMYFAGRAMIDSKTEDTVAGVEWLAKAAAKGYKEALYKLAILHIAGTMIGEDNNKAHQLLQRSVAKGYIPAMQRLASNYYRGAAGMPQDYKKAIEWYERAANHGDDYAAYMLGFILVEGKGVDKDTKGGIGWYERAGKRGYYYGYNNIGNLYYWGTGVDKSYATAVKYYEKAATEGYAVAMNNAGNTYYAGGNGLTQNYPKAAEMYLKGAAKGHAWCMYNYGNMLYKGNGMTIDYGKAAEWYTKAAENNNTDAMDKLAEMYTEGVGVKKDKKKADEWAARSAALKSAE